MFKDFTLSLIKLPPCFSNIGLLAFYIKKSICVQLLQDRWKILNNRKAHPLKDVKNPVVLRTTFCKQIGHATLNETYVGRNVVVKTCKVPIFGPIPNKHIVRSFNRVCCDFTYFRMYQYISQTCLFLTL
uniref:Uncharacterized protein n=1 Tax=Amphimedon queenslandica TaxID=400682 RepID=A0A1X7VTP0_AMPQE